MYKFYNFYENCFRLGSDPENVFPYSAMMEHLQKFGKYGLVQASFAIPFIEAEANVENVGTNVPPRGLSKNLKKRLRDIVADMERLGYIWNGNIPSIHRFV